MGNYEHRKARKKIIITDADGKPASGKQVSVKLKNHSFLFGWGAFDVMEHTNADTEEKKERFCTRAKRWEELFNYGTLPFYWGLYEPSEGDVRQEQMLNCVNRLVNNGKKVKGHPLCWHTVCADWLLKYSNEEIMQRQLDRITREVSAFKGKVGLWDVINETVIMPVFDKYDNAVTRLCNHYGRIPLIQSVFAAAKAADPNAVLLINDFNTSEDYAEVIDKCLDAGVPIDAIGIQSHQHQGYWGAEKLERVLHRFERFGLPIHFTENTIISGRPMPPEIVDLNDFHAESWDSLPEYEERQKKELEEMYRILFAHPLVEAVTGWDFTDGGWLNAPSGILRRDGSPKPAYDMLSGLIKKQWSTEYSALTDDNGCFELYGFKGEYDLSFDGREYMVMNDGKDTEEGLQLSER
ncbi:MAG: endo-1,4-beta-xylanase [Oscillospiraceae bacterium]|nr:endo-1,4-beta-xylanase [Oscillospiraceae bacterium]